MKAKHLPLYIAFAIAASCGGPKKEAPPPEDEAQKNAAQAAQQQAQQQQAQAKAAEEKKVARLGLFKPVPQDNLLARTLFSGNPTYALPLVSPDGKFLAHLQAVEGVMNIWLAPFDEQEKAQALTTVKDRPLRQFFWAYDSKTILYMQDAAGNENFHIYAVDIKDKKTRDITDYPNTRAILIALSSKNPGSILVALNDRDPKFHDVYKIDIKSGKRTLVFKNEDGYAGFTADHDLKLRLLSKQTPDGGVEYFEPKGKKPTSFAKVPMEDGLTTEPWTFDASGKTLYMVDSRGRDKAAAV